jgi:DNA mismatch repair protein MutS
MTAAETPLMQQWREIKARHPDALVFFRVGDFYEMFYGDAEEGARLLDLTLTSRNNGSSRAPLAGIPVHALDTYLQRLIRLGRRVAICEQVEDPAQAKGIVRREVVETITPGTVLADGLLNARRNNFLAAVAGPPGGPLPVAVAWADLSTGELSTTEVPWAGLADALGRIDPTELVLPRSWELFGAAGAPNAMRTYRPDSTFDFRHGTELLIRHFGVASLEGFGFRGADEPLVSACGALADYLAQTQPSASAALRPPRIVRQAEMMELDEMTRRNLELVESLGSGPGGVTVLSVLDQALTPMGARLMRRWLLAPLTDLAQIGRRHDAVAELVQDPKMRGAIRKACGEIRDQERLAAKIAGARCTPRDLLAVADSLNSVPLLGTALEPATAELIREQLEGLDTIPELRDLISSAISTDAPPTLGDGEVIRPGFDQELDSIREVRDGAVEWIARLQAQERERTGIGSLKVGFNRVFGYYIEITRTHLERVPEDYQRRQTLANAERYITPELKHWEEQVLGAEERILGLEARLFQGIRERAAALVPRLQQLADRIARVDLLAGLAEVASRREYVRPAMHEGFDLAVLGGRHPVVETMMPREEFIPNDVELREDARVMILTGPNMAGKSTVLRQVGLIALLAQIGSFVPAQAASLPVVDRIFTRVGASDNLVRGQSTFMVEMTETAAILNGATRRSLVLLDEIGRGTSTWDGMSVATAVTEFLHERIGAKTIFATHYHELTALAERMAGVFNRSVAVREEENRIIFLRSLIAGGADRSYGVEVARLAGLPAEVIHRARELLHDLEGRSETGRGSGAVPAPGRDVQLTLFPAPPHPALERLRRLDPNHLTPIQALRVLADLVALAEVDPPTSGQV